MRSCFSDFCRDSYKVFFLEIAPAVSSEISPWMYLEILANFDQIFDNPDIPYFGNLTTSPMDGYFLYSPLKDGIE